eukprot:6883192-Alexandrium_andersonii.AAC.1
MCPAVLVRRGRLAPLAFVQRAPTVPPASADSKLRCARGSGGSASADGWCPWGRASAAAANGTSAARASLARMRG